MQFEALLDKFPTISLDEMDKVSLLKRIDTKYVVSIYDLDKFFHSVLKSHRILNINHLLTQNYRTIYYDTSEFDMYVAHHNKKANRYKIRIREYIESNLFFLEIKNKSNKGKTVKKRIKLKEFSISNNKKNNSFIEKNSLWKKSELQAVLGNTFRRITLVDNDLTERLTVDFNLEAWQVTDENQKIDLKHIAIIELKRDVNSMADTDKKLRNLRIQPMGFSKYAVASSILFSGKIKNNNFKKKQRIVDKISSRVM